jgi:hypothetical protein
MVLFRDHERILHLNAGDSRISSWLPIEKNQELWLSEVDVTQSHL